jgi:ferric-dicitrate binding protein FerR (iron transport regulator)
MSAILISGLRHYIDSRAEGNEEATMVRETGNTLSLDRRRVLGTAVGAAFLAPNIANAQTPQPVGSVEDIKGEAFADSRDKRRALERAAPLYLTDVVATGPDSRLVLHLGTMTTLKLGASARLTIDKFLLNVGGEITLQSGPILFDRPEDSPPTDMQFHSSFGLIAVRGTRFFAGPSNNVFGVFVARGRVAVSGAGTQVVVEAGQGTNIAQPGAAPTPPAPWGEPRIRAAMASAEM